MHVLDIQFSQGTHYQLGVIDFGGVHRRVGHCPSEQLALCLDGGSDGGLDSVNKEHFQARVGGNSLQEALLARHALNIGH